MSDPGSAQEMVAAIDAEQARLRGLLAGRDEAAMAARPANGKWSVNENIRHLLFAEEIHLGRFVPGGLPKSPLGIPPDGMRNSTRLRGVGFVEEARVEDVLAAWEASHAAIRPHVQGDDAKRLKGLDVNLRHLRAHVRLIERLLRQG